MSRTDAHTPGWVRARRKEELGKEGQYKVFHHHEDGICDLNEGEFWAPPHCYIQYWGHVNICGCNLCTGQMWRKLERKAERVAWRNTRARLMADPWADDYVDYSHRW